MLIKTTMRHYIIGVTRIKACTITNTGKDMEIGKLIHQFVQLLQPLWQTAQQFFKKGEHSQRDDAASESARCATLTTPVQWGLIPTPCKKKKITKKTLRCAVTHVCSQHFYSNKGTEKEESHGSLQAREPWSIQLIRSIKKDPASPA